MSQSSREAERRQMVEVQIRRRGIRSQAVLYAMLAVPRHEFVPPLFESEAYADRPLPIGEGQTISQPLMVAAMTEALELKPTDRVLEIGTGSGYQTAVLARLAAQVYSIEFHAELAQAARDRLHRLGIENVQVRQGDGGLGWPEEAPFDAILVTAAAPKLPPPLIEQLGEGGRLVIPVGGERRQDLLQLRKHDGAIEQRSLSPCAFVPLVGVHGRERGFFG